MVDRVERDRNVAILMDFENTKDANLQRILSSAAAFGQVIIRRAYADWAMHANAQNRLREAGFEAVHQFTTGHGSKNATDINLVVDAMDLLWSRPVDVFVLVTADSDFAKLAMRLREGGKQVVGIGAKGRVGRALVQACDQYIYYDEGAQAKSSGRRKRKGSAPVTAPAPPKGGVPAPKVSDGGKAVIDKVHMMVLNSLEPAADDDGWVYGSPLHRTMKRLYPDFNYQELGHSTFRGFIESLAPIFETDTAPGRSDFLVWIDEDYEDMAWAAVEAKDREVNLAGATSSGGDGVVLAEAVQERIHEEWNKIAGKRGRLQGSRAGSIVAEEYGAERLADTPLANLDGVLAAAPRLAERWKRERATLVRKA